MMMDITTRGEEAEPQHGNPSTPYISSMHLPSERPTSHMRVNARHYNGLSSWREYQSHFERVSRINQWTEEQKLDFLWIHLTDSALTYVENLAPERTVSYQELCDALNQRFGDGHLTEIFKSELRCRRRKEGESLPGLAQDINRLVKSAYPDIGRQGMEELAIERFRESLPDHEQRMAVFQSKAKTMDQAVTAAIDVESWQLSERRRTPTQKARNSRE